jgi:hypothetical protein
MLKPSTLMLASALLLASGCAAANQRAALQQSCDNGNKDACQQIAQNEGQATYFPPPNVRVFPAGQTAAGGFSGVGGISGIGGVK